jgi:hypothetical protein
VNRPRVRQYVMSKWADRVFLAALLTGAGYLAILWTASIAGAPR